MKDFNKNILLIVIIIISFLFLLLSYVPNIYEASVVNLLPGDRVMLWGEHIYTYDYNVYLSKIRQGQEGRWTVVDKYDNNPQQKGAFLQMLYLISGKLTSLFQIGPVLTFHLMRTVFSFFWVLTIIFLNVYFLKSAKLYIPGILLSLVASSFPVFYRFENQTWVGGYMSWWQEMDVLKRISYLPHYTLNYIIISVLILLLYLSSTHENKKYFFLICLIEFFSFFIHPAGGLLFLFSWVIYHLVRGLLFRQYTKKQWIMIFIRTMTLFIIALIAVIYIKYITSFYPWKSLVDFDKNHRMAFSVKEYILSLGPIFFTGLAGMLLVILKKEKRFLTLSAWLLGAGFAILVFKYIPFQSELRFIQTANHIPLSILSVYFFYFLVKKYNLLLIKLLTCVTITVIIFLGIIQSYFSLKAQMQFIHQRAVAVLPLVPYPPQVMYPLTDFYAGLKWLEQNTSRSKVVLAKITAGNYIPAYTGNFVYFGHSETPHYEERNQEVNNFFTLSFNPDEAYSFLKKANISYIFYGPQEKEGSSFDISNYKFLKTVFEGPNVSIFKIL